MPNVFIEPGDHGGYVAKREGGQRVSPVNYPTQAQAIEAMEKAGHNPIVGRVRRTDDGKPGEWRKP